MRPVENVLVTKELITLFKNQVRIIDIKHPDGIWPVDIRQLKRLRTLFPELLDDKILKGYDVVVTYSGKNMEEDFKRLEIQMPLVRTLPKNVPSVGIPADLRFLQVLKKYREGLEKEMEVFMAPKQKM